MDNKNVYQDGNKSTEGVISIFNPYIKKEKEDMNVEVQQGNAPEVIQNVDHSLPANISTEQGLGVLTESKEAKDLYQNRVNQSQLINYTAKEPMSGNAIDINFGASLEETINIMITLLERGLLEENSESVNILNGIYEHIANYRQSGEIPEALPEGVASLKISLLEDLNSAKGKFYAQNENAYQTVLMGEIEDYIKRIQPIVKIYVSDGEEATNVMQGKIAEAYNNIFDYQVVDSPYKTSRTSKLAKERLLENPWYLGYVREMGDTSPELLEQVAIASENPYITDIEEKVIREILSHNQELSRQKNIIKEEVGWNAMMQIFDTPQEHGGTLNQLLDMQWELNKTALDDEIEKSIQTTGKVGVDFDNLFQSTQTHDYEVNSSIGSSGELSETAGLKADLSTGAYDDIYVRPFLRDPTWDDATLLKKREEYNRNLRGGANTRWSEVEQKMVPITKEKPKDYDRRKQQILKEKEYYAKLTQDDTTN